MPVSEERAASPHVSHRFRLGNPAETEHVVVHSGVWSFTAVLFLCAVIVYAFDPGHLDGDALPALMASRIRVYSDWHPLLLPSLLDVCTRVGIGPVGVLAIQVFTLGCSIYWLMILMYRPWISVLGTYIVLLSPAVLGYLGAITNHALVGCFTIAGLTLLAYAVKERTSPRRQIFWASSFLALSLASIARVNAPPLTFPCFIVWTIFFLRGRKLVTGTMIRQALVATGLGLILTIFPVLLATTLLRFLYRPIHAEPAESLMLYDITAISMRAHRVLVGPVNFPSQRFADLQALYVENNPDLLIFWGNRGVPRLRVLPDAGTRSEVEHEWRSAITSYPFYYITERYRMFRGLLGLDFKTLPVVPYHPGIDPNTMGYHLAHPIQDALVVKYLSSFERSWVDRPFIYFILLAIALWTLFRKRFQDIDLEVILWALALGSFSYILLYFVASPSTLLRYTWPCIVSNTTVFVVVMPYCFGRAVLRRSSSLVLSHNV